MFRFILSRFFSAIPTLFFIITLTFFLMRVAPGGPFDDENVISNEVKENLEKIYHLNESLTNQYFYYLKNILQGDLGPSFQYRDFSVIDLIMQGLPVSITLGALAMFFAIIIGITLGIMAAFYHNKFLDKFLRAFSVLGIAIPSFILAPILTLLLGVYLRALPVGGWGGGDIKHLFLPVVSLCVPQIAYICRLTRAGMLDSLKADYIRTAYAKGLSNKTILLRHALWGGILPVISYLGPATASILTGSVVVEKIYSIPGIGRYFIHGALNRDYTLVLGVIIFYSIILITLNLIVDILYAFIDPRIRIKRDT